MPAWSAFESIPGLTATYAEWQKRSADGFKSIERFLRPTGKSASVYPCPKKQGCGCAHDVVVHSKDDIVGVCRCRPRNCKTFKIERVNLLLYELDRERIGSAIAETLGAKADNEPIDRLHLTWRIGVYSPRPGAHLPLFLTIQFEPDDFKRVVEGLIARNEQPFLLMAPTSVNWKHEYDDLLRRRKARFIALNEILTWNGNLTIKQSLADILGEFLEEVGPPLKELFLLRNDGATWSVIFRGEEKSIPNSKGVHYIATLLAAPNKEIYCGELHGSISAISLDAMVDGQHLDDDNVPKVSASKSKKSKSISVNSVIDSEALNNYKNCIKTLQDQIEEAEDLCNNEKAAELKQELNTLTKEIGRTVGYRGKVRTEGPTKKARQAVSKNINLTLKAVKNIHPALWKHLDASIKRGEFLVYRPEEDFKWTIRA